MRNIVTKFQMVAHRFIKSERGMEVLQAAILIVIAAAAAVLIYGIYTGTIAPKIQEAESAVQEIAVGG